MTEKEGLYCPFLKDWCRKEKCALWIWSTDMCALRELPLSLLRIGDRIGEMEEE